MTRRRDFCAAALLALTPLARAAAAAWGASAIRLIVGAPAGAGTDLEARAFAPFLERHLPHAGIEIVNLPGEAGLVALRALAAAAPDPLTLGWVATPNLAARMVDSDQDGLIDRMALLGAVQEEPLVLLVPPSNAVVSAAEVLRAAAIGDQALPFGTPPAGSPPHLGALYLQHLAGMTLNIVPFPSVASVRQAVADGNVAAALLALGDAIGALRDGRLTGLGISGARRIDALADMPTLAEADCPLPATILRGLALPAGLPAPVVAALKGGLQAVVADPEYKAQGDASGFDLIWLDGTPWLVRVNAERSELRKLWQSSPWLPAKGG